LFKRNKKDGRGDVGEASGSWEVCVSVNKFVARKWVCNPEDPEALYLNVFHQALVPIVFPGNDPGSWKYIGNHVEQNFPVGVEHGKRRDRYWRNALSTSRRLFEHAEPPTAALVSQNECPSFLWSTANVSHV